jgi:hypothetical protein
MQTFSESKRLAEAKMIDRQQAMVGQHNARAAVSMMKATPSALSVRFVSALESPHFKPG